MRQFAFSHAGTLTFGKVDVDRHPELARDAGVRSLPSFVLYKDGVQKETQIGFDPQALERLVRRYRG